MIELAWWLSYFTVLSVTLGWSYWAHKTSDVPIQDATFGMFIALALLLIFAFSFFNLLRIMS